MLVMWKRLVLATVFSVYSFNLSVSWGTTSASATGKIQLVEATLAVVNKEPILFSDLRLYQLLFQISDAKKALEKLIDIYLVSQYAKERGVKSLPKKFRKLFGILPALWVCLKNSSINLWKKKI